MGESSIAEIDSPCRNTVVNPHLGAPFMFDLELLPQSLE
jgi:hypothetical protein